MNDPNLFDSLLKIVFAFSLGKEEDVEKEEEEKIKRVPSSAMYTGCIGLCYLDFVFFFFLSFCLSFNQLYPSLILFEAKTNTK